MHLKGVLLAFCLEISVGQYASVLKMILCYFYCFVLFFKTYGEQKRFREGKSRLRCSSRGHTAKYDDLENWLKLEPNQDKFYCI